MRGKVPWARQEDGDTIKETRSPPPLFHGVFISACASACLHKTHSSGKNTRNCVGASRRFTPETRSHSLGLKGSYSDRPKDILWRDFVVSLWKLRTTRNMH